MRLSCLRIPIRAKILNSHDPWPNMLEFPRIHQKKSSINRRLVHSRTDRSRSITTMHTGKVPWRVHTISSSSTTDIFKVCLPVDSKHRLFMKRPANCSVLLMPITNNDVNACGFDRVDRFSYESLAFFKEKRRSTNREIALQWTSCKDRAIGLCSCDQGTSRVGICMDR